jgi:spermidine synthase
MRALGIGIGLLSLAVMAAEIVLTRLFSVVLWYHFAFFAISISLLGLGAGAAFVHARRGRLMSAAGPEALSRGSLLAGVALLALEVALLQGTSGWLGPVGLLLVMFTLAALPFAAAGFVLSVLFMRHGAAMHRLYAWDLAGAGLACLLVVPLLDRLGGPEALAVCAALAASASVPFAASAVQQRGQRVVKSAVLTLGVVALCAGCAASGLLEVRLAKGVDLIRQPPEVERWSSFSLVNVFARWPFRGWGISPTYRGPIARQKGVVIDLNAFTPLNAFDGDFAAVAYTQHDLSALAFRLREEPAREVCIVGAGGGKDVLAALAVGTEHVVGVEVNPLIVELVRGPYRAFTGGLYERDDVEIHVEDGRSFLRRDERMFDVILISMVDTSAATAAGAFALAENALYTTDAFDDFLSRLAPGGMLTVSSVSFEGLATGARLASLARSALQARGADPARSVAVIETPWLSTQKHATMYNFVIKPSGFDADELERLRAVTAELGFKITYEPDIATKAKREAVAIDRILRATDDAALAREVAGWRYDVSPVSDDRPFFFYQSRLRDAGSALFSLNVPQWGNGLVILIKVLVAAALMLALLIAAPLALARGSAQALRGSRAQLATDLGYVTCVGLGFMFLEIALIQRSLSYLGQPTYTLTAVLFVLLIGGGLGSRIAGGLSQAAIARAIAVLIGYALMLAFGFGALADATAMLGMLGRALTVAMVLFPLGVLLGMPLPSALARVHGRSPDRIPWLWGINSAASVLGSITATIVSMNIGITASMLAGALFYGAARALWSKL